jgi:pyrroline-5-carboxylate reductase
MAEAILSRLLETEICTPDLVWLSEPQSQRRQFLLATYGVRVTADNREVATAADALLLAIKPQVLKAVAAEFAGDARINSEALIISILAGVKLGRLATIFPENPLIRAMPNTPATVGAGMTAISPGQKVAPHHLELARSIFAAVGEVVEVSESLMDAVTGLSGSAPAFVAIMVEALADGGVAAGLPRPVAAQLALQTVLGTAQLLHHSSLHPAQLKDRVASAGGTTIAGVAQLEKLGFRSALLEAVKAAAARSQELGS